MSAGRFVLSTTILANGTYFLHACISSVLCFVLRISAERSLHSCEFLANGSYALHARISSVCGCALRIRVSDKRLRLLAHRKRVSVKRFALCGAFLTNGRHEWFAEALSAAPPTSVVDVAAAITGKPHDVAAQDFRPKSKTYPDVSAKCTDVKFPDARGRRGQRTTNVTDARNDTHRHVLVQSPHHHSSTTNPSHHSSSLHESTAPPRCYHPQ